jgi:hypothetical protein
MYRGSRLAASFLLFLTGTAATAVGLGVAPSVFGAAWPLAALAVTFGIAHFVALAGIYRAREWGRTHAVTIAQIGGGLSIAALVAIVMGASAFGSAALPAQAAAAKGAGLALWTMAMYLLLGISAGRIRFAGSTRRSTWWPTPLLRAGA